MQGSLVLNLGLSLEKLESLSLQHSLMICNWSWFGRAEIYSVFAYRDDLCLSSLMASTSAVKEDKKEQFLLQSPLATKK